MTRAVTIARSEEKLRVSQRDNGGRTNVLSLYPEPDPEELERSE